MTNLIFKNEIKLSEQTSEVDKRFDERRISLLPLIKNHLLNFELFKDQDVAVTFINGKGVSSIISLLETGGRRFILKIPLSIKYSLGEAQFLKVWASAGVNVPNIIDDGMLGEHPYIIYDYIEADTLIDSYSRAELVENRIFVEIGQTMRMMHVPKATGYGHVIDGKAEYLNFEDWLESPELMKKIGYVVENKIITEEHGSIIVAKERLKKFIGKENVSSYCHEDITISNIFNTEPLTVFDPNPRFNHGYIDLARAIQGTIFDGDSDEARTQLLEGYFGADSYDIHALHATVVFYCYMKLPYAHKNNKTKNIKNIQEYLLRTRDLLVMS